MSWITKDNQIISSLEDMPEGVFGFVYKILNHTNGKFYIGKKQVVSITKKKLGKGEIAQIPDKRKANKYKSKNGSWNYYTELIKESDWKNYTGSCKPLNLDIENGANITKQILEFAHSKIYLNYLEIKHLFIEEVLEREDAYNGNINGRWFKFLFDRNAVLERNRKIKENSTNKKSVLQFTLDGVFLKRYESISETGINNVGAGASGKYKIIKDSIWIYESEFSNELLMEKIEKAKNVAMDKSKKISIASTGRTQSEESRKKKSEKAKGVPKSEDHKRKISLGNGRPILQYNLNGIFINKYSSSLMTGYNNARYAASGKIKTSHGFIWIWEDEFSDNLLQEKIKNAKNNGNLKNK